MTWRAGIVVPMETSVEVLVSMPATLYALVKRLAEVFSDVEFLVYTRGHVHRHNDSYIVVIGDDVYVPRQRVTLVSVEVVDENATSYNIVIHKHPDGIDSFSSTDDEYINANNDASLLYERGAFVHAAVRSVIGDVIVVEKTRNIKVELRGLVDHEKLEEQLWVAARNVTPLHPTHKYNGMMSSWGWGTW